MALIERPNCPLYNDQKLKLGLFGTNCSNGLTVSHAPTTYRATWEHSLAIAQRAEAIGFEMLVPIARWRGFGGTTDFNGIAFETYTWAAGLAAATEKIMVFATSHVPTIHPVLAAKAAATIDHISGGRFGLNIVAGWNAEEIAMFYPSQRAHDERYAVADEWITLIKRLWTEEGTFDFAGTYFTVPNAYSEPKPVQQPHPVVMSAGLSPAGRRFAAKHADLNFVLLPDLEVGRAVIAEIKELARREFGREILVFGMGYVVCRDTEREAREFVHYYVHEKGDWQGVRNLLNTLMPNSQSASQEQFEAMAANFIAGYSALPLVGTPEQVVEGMQRMSTAGMDGITLSWVDYEFGLEQFQEQILPLMVEAGL